MSRAFAEVSGESYGRAYAFTAQGRMDFYAWILAENGTVWRHFVWDGGVVVDIVGGR